MRPEETSDLFGQVAHYTHVSQPRRDVGHPTPFRFWGISSEIFLPNYFEAAAFLGNISPMRRIWAPTPLNFSSMCS